MTSGRPFVVSYLRIVFVFFSVFFLFKVPLSEVGELFFTAENGPDFKIKVRGKGIFDQKIHN